MEKGFEKIGRMKDKRFIFNFAEDILFFSLLYGNELFFSKKSQPPPPRISNGPSLMTDSLVC